MSRNIKLLCSIGLLFLGAAIVSIAANITNNPDSPSLPYYIAAAGMIVCGIAITWLLILVIYKRLN